MYIFMSLDPEPMLLKVLNKENVRVLAKAALPRS